MKINLRRVEKGFFEMRLPALQIFLSTFMACILLGATIGPALAQQVEPDFFPDLEQPMVFHEAYSGGNCDSCVWISAQGEITTDTPRRFQAFWEEIKAEFEGTSIHLNSRGGDLGSALALGRMFRDTGLATVVAETAGFNGPAGPRDGFLETDDAVCESACVFAFIGGTNRAASQRTDGEETGYQKIGTLKVHQFSSKTDGRTFTAEERVKDQVRTAVLLEYVVDMGVSADLLSIALSVPPNQDLHTLSEGEIIQLGLDTFTSHIKPNIRGYSNGVGVVEFEKTTRRGRYRYEFFCDKKMQALLKITFFDSEVDLTKNLDSASSYVSNSRNFLENLLVPIPGETELISSSQSFPEGANAPVVEATYRGNGSHIKELIEETKFDFGHPGSSYDGFLALDLNVQFSEGFDGFYLLPRLCIQ